MFQLHDDSHAPQEESPGKKAADTRRRRRRERETRAWLGRLSVIIDQPPYGDIDWPISEEIRGGDIAAALERAISEVRYAMQPLPPGEIFNLVLEGVEDPRPLEQDVTITHGGKVLAIVQATAAGPVVTRFGATDPASPADPR